MRTLWRRKIAIVFIVILLFLSGCSSNAVPTTAPTKIEESNQVKNPEPQSTTDKTDTITAPNISETTASEKTPEIIVDPPQTTPSSKPITPPVVAPAPAPEPVVTSAPSSTPASPPVVTPTPAPAQTPQDITVYVTKTGKKYHRDGCRYLSNSKIPISLSDAKLEYGPCSGCNPPQ